MMEKESEAFNALPDETRKIYSRLLLRVEVRLMETEKNRLKRRYNQSLKEINEKIKYMESELAKEYK